MPFTIDIDTGGTFTDGVYNHDGQIETVKVPTTPHDLTVCFVENMEEAARRFGITLDHLLRSTSVIRYANTIGTNTIIQKSGPRLGLIVSRGNENRLYGEEDIWDNPNHPLRTFIRQEMVIGIEGEADQQGRVIRQVNKEEVLEQVQRLIDLGARAVVISLKGSYENPSIEQEVKQIVKEEFPNYYLGTPSLFLASEICDYPGEALRTNTTLLNAYIHREMARTLYKAEEKVRDRHYRHPLLIVHSSGGASRVAKTRAINTYNSGPAAGLAGAQSVGRLLGYKHMITADMGGTSLDIGLILNGKKQYELTPKIEGIGINHPMVRIDAIGAGGGSIARVDASDGGKTLRIGPESAGSSPGPVCFNRGGRKITVTDADLVLGYLDPDYFLAGRIKLDKNKTIEAMERQIAKPLGVSVVEAAWMIKRQVDGFIRDNIRQLLANEEPIDRKDTVLFAYGGGGATHCVGFSEALPVDAIVVSPFSSVFSAYGSSTVDVLHQYMSTRPVDLTDSEAAREKIGQALQELQRKAERDMRGEGFRADELAYSVEFTLAGPDGTERTFFFQQETIHPDSLVNEILREKDFRKVSRILLSAVAKVPHHEPVKHEPAAEDVSSAKRGEREAYWGPEYGIVSTPVYSRELLKTGHKIQGPALIDALDTTMVVPFGYSVTIDAYQNAIIKEESE